MLSDLKDDSLSRSNDTILYGLSINDRELLCGTSWMTHLFQSASNKLSFMFEIHFDVNISFHLIGRAQKNKFSVRHHQFNRFCHIYILSIQMLTYSFWGQGNSSKIFFHFNKERNHLILPNLINVFYVNVFVIINYHSYASKHFGIDSTSFKVAKFRSQSKKNALPWN